ncbi:MAG: MBL fold metallo-hydrolase [Acidimicrobiia bacterium]
MRVHVMGSSGTFPVPGRPASGYLIEQEGTRVWCDAGPGTFTALPVEPDLIDAIVISHQHPDHCSDLMTAFHSWTYRPEPRTGIPLYAPQSVWDRLSSFLDQGQGSHLERCYDFHPVWSGDTVEIGTFTVSFAEMDHSVPTVGSRWEANHRTLFFTGDTGPNGGWREMARDVDVFLTEAGYQGEGGVADYPHHLTASEAGLIAREVGAKRVVLTHIPPYLDVARSVHEAEQTFDRPVAVATPGAQFDV